MSLYEDYSKTNDQYISNRVPAGCAIVLDLMKEKTKRDVSELSVLEVGSGTGNFVKEVAKYAKQVTGLEPNDGMRQQAKQQCSAYDNVSFKEGVATNIPFADNSFDVVMCVHVLHHLEDGSDPEYTTTHKAVSEASRVCKPGGVVIYGFTTKEQVEKAYWFFRFIPNAVEDLDRRTASTVKMKEFFKQEGLKEADMVPCLDELLYSDEYYFDVEGPLDASWRQADSTWALASEEELRRATDEIKKLLKEGKLNEFIQQCEEDRKRMGQVGFLAGVKKN